MTTWMPGACRAGAALTALISFLPRNMQKTENSDRMIACGKLLKITEYPYP